MKKIISADDVIVILAAQWYNIPFLVSIQHFPAYNTPVNIDIKPTQRAVYVSRYSDLVGSHWPILVFNFPIDQLCHPLLVADRGPEVALYVHDPLFVVFREGYSVHKDGKSEGTVSWHS